MNVNYHNLGGQMKKLTIITLLFLFATAAVFGQATEDKVVAKVNDDIEVMLSELQAEIRSLPQERQEIATTKEGVDQILDQIIRRKLLAKQAKAMQVDTIPIVQQAIDNAIEGILADFMIIQLRQSTQPVTEQQAQQFYTQNESLFYSAPTLQLKQIVVATSEEAAEVEKKLENQEFDELIDMYPGIPGGANSGNLGTIPVNQLSPDVYNRIKDLQPGEYAGPIQTGAGFHFIKVMKKTPSQKVEYENISKNLQEQLTANAASQNVTGYIQNLVNEATITRNNAAIKEAILQPAPQGGMGGQPQPGAGGN